MTYFLYQCVCVVCVSCSCVHVWYVFHVHVFVWYVFHVYVCMCGMCFMFMSARAVHVSCVQVFVCCVCSHVLVLLMLLSVM